MSVFIRYLTKNVFRLASQNDHDYPNFVALFGGPLITPDEKDVTLELHTNFSMTCASKEPITWKPFEVFFLLI